MPSPWWWRSISWFDDPHRIEGNAPGVRAEAPADALGVPPGEWHAYGRTGHGQRYSPLDQITPENVAQLEVAWTYHTGDVRGRPGDPEETTFEVTPLKIGNRLFLCTPHQNVIALDATTGAEIWRYDPKIRSELALQHLTCRGPVLPCRHPAAALQRHADLRPRSRRPARGDDGGAGRLDRPGPAGRSLCRGPDHGRLPGQAVHADGGRPR